MMILYVEHNIVMYITVIIISYYDVRSIRITSLKGKLGSNGSRNRGIEVAYTSQEHEVGH